MEKPEGRWVRAEIDVEAPAPAVLEAFTRPESLATWFGVDRAVVEPRAGGTWALAWGLGEAGVTAAAVGVVASLTDRELVVANLVSLGPGRLLGPTRLSVRVKPKSHKTVVSLTEDGFGDGPAWDALYEDSRQSWPVMLLDLKHHLEENLQVP